MFLLVAWEPVIDPDDSSSSDPGVTDQVTSDPTDTASETSSEPDKDVKTEIDENALNYYFDFDLYSLLPKIYSADYLISEDSNEDYPIDVYIDLFDWDEQDIESYDDDLALLFAYDHFYGYIIKENLFIFATVDGNPYINIYSVAFYVPIFESSLWPKDAINAFFNSDEIGSLVPAFVSESSFNYYIVGEDEYAQLIIYTDYPTIDGENIYVNSLLNDGWIVDETYYDLFGYVCWDIEQQISLVFYWWDGVMYWSFMYFE